MNTLKKISEKNFVVICFISSFLVFAVQPLFGKLLLPSFGGAPFVWNTSLFFFQILLFSGYLYAFVLSRLFSGNWRMQALVHLGLLIVIAAFQPIKMPDLSEFNVSFLTHHQNILFQLEQMFAGVGLPYFILCASTPLAQYWYTRINANECPYHLFSISNAGSFCALLGYPFLVEVLWGTVEQVSLWGYGFLFLVTLFIAHFIFNLNKTSQRIGNNTNVMDNYCHSHRLIILALSALPSAILVGFSNFLTTDLAATPLLWIIPLALYLLSFVVAFNKETFFTRRYSYYLQSTVIFLFLAFCMLDLLGLRAFTWVLQFSIFFLTCLVCHHELFKFRGSSEILNEFYVLIALGGAIGGFFITFVAPSIFEYPWEYSICLALSLFFRYASDEDQNFDALCKQLRTSEFWASNAVIAALCTLFFGIGAAVLTLGHTALIIISAFACFGIIFIFDKRWLFALSVGTLLLVHPAARWQNDNDILTRERNFFGVTTVRDDFLGIPKLRVMHHGSTAHGVQSFSDGEELVPLSYFYYKTPIGDIFNYMDKAADTPEISHQNVGVIGLGVGTLSCYPHIKRSFEFYEINPSIIRIAQDEKYFTYLRKCGSPYQIIEGDGRIEIGKFNGKYDLLFIDAFSSDSIPMHLVTKEAFNIYRDKLSDTGFIVVNITNRYLDLKDELNLIARSLDLAMTIKSTPLGNVENSSLVYFPATFVVMSKDGKRLEEFVGLYEGWSSAVSLYDETHLEPWTDDHSFFLRALNLNGFSN